MCGRKGALVIFSVSFLFLQSACTLAPDTIISKLHLKRWPDKGMYRTSYNIAPTQVQAVVYLENGERCCRMMKWCGVGQDLRFIVSPGVLCLLRGKARLHQSTPLMHVRRAFLLTACGAQWCISSVASLLRAASSSGCRPRLTSDLITFA